MRLIARTAALGLAFALMAPAVVACTSHASVPPPSAATLIVHAMMMLGSVDSRTGQAAVEFPMGKTRVSVQGTNGASMIVTTNINGDARFLLAPGVYVARLADLAQPDGRGGGPHIVCGVEASPVSVRVQPHLAIRAELDCVQP